MDFLLGDGFWNLFPCFSASWSDSGYIFPPVYRGPGTRILRSILVRILPHCLVRPWIQFFASFY